MRTIWINFGIYTGTILWTIIATLLSPVAYILLKKSKRYSKVEAVRRLVWIYGRVWVFWTSLFVPIKQEEKMPPSPCVMVLNHASFFDTYLVGAQRSENICLSIREWPYKIPFYRPFMKAAQYVRTENAKPGQVLKQSVQAIKSGSNMVFFPEGTRSTDGKLGRFHSGAFYVALKANVPVVPVCISGNHEFLPRGKKMINYSPIKVSLLPAIYPAKYHDIVNGHIQMRKDVKALMAHALEKMSTVSRQTPRRNS